MSKGESISGRVIKAMSVFGGVQVVGILCSILRTKLVAIWIGAAGVGLFGIFNSAVEMLSQITYMGIGSSGTRDVAACDDEAKRRRTITIVRRWSVWLGLGGALITFLIAPLLSRWSFGDDTHVWAFRWLSLSVLFYALYSGEFAVLQGLSRLRRVARANMFGCIVGTAIAVPLFYFFRISSIVPVVICTGGSLVVGTYLFRERDLKEDRTVTLRDTLAGGRSLITLGFYITLSAIVSSGASYLLMAWFTTSYSSDMAGLFQAGFTLINRYVGLVFTAIAMEYFPRLSGVSNRRLVSEVFVSHEMKLALSVLVPVIGAFIVVAPLLIPLFYSSTFIAITPFMEIGVTGTIFRAVSWCMAFMMLVRGDGRIYLVTESISALMYVVINIGAYHLWGIEGMGVAYVTWYFIYAVVVFVVYRRRYGMHLRRGMVSMILYSIVAVALILASAMLLSRLLAVVLTIASAIVSLRIMGIEMPRLR